MKNTRRCPIFKQTGVSPVNYISSKGKKFAHNIKGNFSALKKFSLLSASTSRNTFLIISGGIPFSVYTASSDFIYKFRTDYGFCVHGNLSV